MENPIYELTHDYVHENEISVNSYNNGYLKGLADGTQNLIVMLIKMSDEELLKWRDYQRHIINYGLKWKNGFTNEYDV